MNIKQLFRISYEKQIVYFVLLLLVFFGFTEIVSVSFIRKMEYKWMLSKKAEFSVFQEAITRILPRPQEEVKRRLLTFTENPNLRRIVILDKDGSSIFDTSPYSERILIPKGEKKPYLRIEHKGGSMVASYWSRFFSETGDQLYLVLFSPEEEIPFLLRFLKINSFVKLSGTFIAFILGIYFILFVLSPFRRMGEIAREIKEKDVSSVDEIVVTFKETIRELGRLYSREKKKVLRMEKEISLKEHLASLGEMSAGIAHEFKNSIGTIIGFTKLAIKEGGKEEYLKKVKNEADALNNVVNKFLFFAKPQELEKEYCSLKDIVSELVENPPENISVKVEMEGLPNIFADRRLLKRAFSNIVKNGYESMPFGGTISILSSSHPRKHSVKILFHDEGDGIPSNIKSEVFTPFFSTKADGAGLGLSIVYKVITLHNGKVRIKSSKKGTTVEVEIPLVKNEDK